MRFCLAVAASLLVAALTGVGHASAGGDPDLEPGFPVQAMETDGSYHSGPAVHVQVGNIDADPTLEILATALSVGPLYAWNADGSTQPGWPLNTGDAAYPVMGELSSGEPGSRGLLRNLGQPVLRRQWSRRGASGLAAEHGKLRRHAAQPE